MATTKGTGTDRKALDGSGKFSDFEVEAMKERARELKASKKRGGASDADGLADLQAKIAEMAPEDKAMAEKIHEIVSGVSPELKARTWYGMPAWAKDGKTIAYFTPAAKFKSPYATFGFNEDAKLNEGHMWAVAWALTKITPETERELTRLVTKAVNG